MMSRPAVSLLLASALAAAPALAQEPAPQTRRPMSILSPSKDGIQVMPGERVVVTRNSDGKFEIKAEEPIEAAAIMGAAEVAKRPPPTDGQIIFAFAGSP